jgi:OFA family oxalate/formate antiporter-like MFS transporter
MNDERLPASAKIRPHFFYGYVIVILGFLCMLISAGLWDSFGVFITPLLSDFSWNRATVSSAYSLSFLIFGLAGIIAGWLTDRFGPKIILTTCGLLLGAGYLLLSQLNSLWQLFLFEGVFLGLGMSGLYAPILGMIARWFIELRGLMTGIVLAGLGFGELVGPPVISRLVDDFGWHLTFIFMGITVLVVIVVFTQFFKRDPAKMGLIPHGAKEVRTQELENSSAAYSFREATHTWQLWMLLSIKLCFGYYMLTFVIHIVPHAIDLGISPVNAATILAISGGGVVIGSFGLGRAVDKIGPRKVFILCFIAALAMMLLLIKAKDFWALCIISLIIGLANGGNMTSDSPMGARLFGLKSIGSIIGFSSGTFSLGAALGPALTGFIFDSTRSYQTAFYVAATFCVAGIILAVIIRPTSRLQTVL